MQDGGKAVWRIPYVSVAFFPSLKYNFIAYRSSKMSSSPDCIFDIHQLWQSGFSMVYSNCCCSCSFEPDIIKIGQSSHKMYSNNIGNFQESTRIFNACKKIWNFIECTTYLYIFFKYVCPRRDLYFLVFIYLLIYYVRVCFQFDGFVRAHVWHKALLMVYSMRLELTRIRSLNGFQLVMFFFY